MANYRNIKGFTVQSTSTDPVPYIQSWSSGGNLNTAVLGNCGFGTQSAAASVAGTAPSAPGITNHVEEYNGSTWTEVNATPTGYDSMGSCGPQTSGMAFGGQSAPGPNTNNTFEYDGTNWTSGGSLNTARRDLIGAGTQTAGLAALGAVDPPYSAETEKYNGASWTTVAEANTGRRSAGGSGTSTSALAYGGYGPPADYSDAVESWNGASWTEVSELNTKRGVIGSAGDSNTSALAIGGTSPGAQVANVEQWNGSAWTETADLAVARNLKFGLPNGPTNAALAAGGNAPSAPGASVFTEEFSFPGPTSSILIEGQMWYNSNTTALKGFARDVAEGTWASGAAMNNANAAVGSFGISTAAIEFGGYYPPGSAPGRITTEEYDGTTWTEKSDMSIYRAERPGAGTTAAGLAIRGNPGNATAVEAWGGSSWTTVNSSSTPNGGNSACGTQTAAITFGGETTANTELYDGTSWTEVNNMNTARGKMSGSGVQSSAVGSGGTPGPQVLAETWDGSTWSEVTENNTPRSAGAAGGTSNSSALAFGGGPSRTANTEYWNGSSWTEVANLSSATQDMNYGNVGTTGGTLAIGGDASPPVSTRTEAWTATDAVISVTTS